MIDGSNLSINIYTYVHRYVCMFMYVCIFTCVLPTYVWSYEFFHKTMFSIVLLCNILQIAFLKRQLSLYWQILLHRLNKWMPVNIDFIETQTLSRKPKEIKIKKKKQLQTLKVAFSDHQNKL